MHELQTATRSVAPHQQMLDKRKFALGWSDSRYHDNSWFEIPEELRNRRWQNVVAIDRMLRGHRPHEVLTHVPQNVNWLSKTFTLALKIERFIFFGAKSREAYLDVSTLPLRVRFISRCLVRLRERKNLASTGMTDPRLQQMMKRYFG